MEKIAQVTYIIDLPGVDRPAEIVVVRGGQQRPSVGDDVYVRWEIELPADASWLLHPALRFDDRVQVCGAPLTRDWGYDGGDDPPTPHYRFLGRHAAAATWADAFSDAVQAAAEQLRPLVDALQWRQAALATADMAQIVLPDQLEGLVVLDRLVETADDE